MDKPPAFTAPTVVEPSRANDGSIPESDAAPLGERYEILGELGTGGMGRVYRARDRETSEVVALKVLRPEIAADPSMAERFKNELRLARRITHKNVCRIYDFNRIGSVVYISMEYVDGETLRARLNRGGAMPASRVVPLARQICAGLAEAHAQGVIHRDLKPENIMITTTGAVKLMDFGIARSLHANASTTQTLIGTPSYMAPEQVQGRGADARSDIYALGLILYECLTGRRAFTGATPIEVAMKQLQERPTAPQRLRPDVPPALGSVVMRCLEKDPARRFVSVDQVAKALTGTKDGAVAPKRSGRRWRWAIAVAMLVVVGSVWNHRHGEARLSSVRSSATRSTVQPAPPLPSGIRSTDATPTNATMPPQAVTQRDRAAASGSERDQRTAAFRQLPSRGPLAVESSSPPEPNDIRPPDAPSTNAAAQPPATTGGDGVAPDGGERDQHAAAVQHLKEAAEAGDPAAQFRLAQTLFNGPPEIRNKQEARTWLQRSAEQGNTDAQFALGMMYEHGRDGVRDIDAAISWYQRAAAAGNVGAQRNLARLTGRGRVRPRMR